MHPPLEPTWQGMPFLAWWATTKGSSSSLHELHNHAANILLGKGASSKSEWVSLTERAMKALQALKQVCMTALILAFAHYTKLFLLETDVSKKGLGAVLLQRQTEGSYHPIAYGSRALTSQEKNYHSTKLEFLALKWAVTEHFREYLLYQSFVV